MSYKRLVNRIYLASPTMHEEELFYVQNSFDTNWVSTVGENIDLLEKEIGEYVGMPYVVALSSGTTALHMAVKLAGVKARSRVFCSDMTFIATANPVVYEGGVPIFIDTERKSWNMDPEVLDKAFGLYPDVKTVITANLYGTPANLSEIRRICDKHQAVLIEDAAESLGATHEGKQTGTFGDYNIISFNGNKIITTSSGGVLLTESKAAAEKTRFLATQAKENVPWYQHEEIGYNYRMSNVLAGIGRGQMLHLEKHIEKKKTIYERYQKGFCGLPLCMNPIPKESSPNFWMSCILLDEDSVITPEQIRVRLEQYNIESRYIWKPLHMQPVFQKNLFVPLKEGMDVSADIFKRGLCLPSDIKMTEEQQTMVIDLIKDLFT